MSQRVLITAGAGRIGLAIAKAFVARGARVHIADVNAEAVQDITKQCPATSGTVSDVSQAADLDALFNEVLDELGGLNVLVNNAGIAAAIDAVRHVPYYVDRALEGAMPSHRPIEQPSRFYLTLNLKSARALGLELPPSLLVRAEEVIE